MPRVFIVSQKANLQALSTSLLGTTLSNTQATSALQSLQVLNPHVDLKNVPAGTVLLVPDEPGFTASASDSVGGGVLEGFQRLVQGELNAAAKRLKEGQAARAGQRAEVAAVQKTAAFKKIVEKDPQLKQQLDEAAKASKEDQQQDALAEQTLDAAKTGAMAELASLAKLLG